MKHEQHDPNGTLASSIHAVIIGSGFGGISAAVNLDKIGLDDFVILERRPFCGGTWAQNRYPGAAVDVQSPLYSLSFAPHDWQQMYAKQDEIEAYTQGLFRKFDLLHKVQTQAEVTRLSWDSDSQVWLVEVNHSLRYKAKIIINASGPLSTPVTPRIKGMKQFTGQSFHTNDWPDDVDLTSKRVAIVGSGASAIQVIPAIAERVKQLHVFQRTPHWVLPRSDYVFARWQRRLMKTVWGNKAVRWAIYWTLEFRILGIKYSSTLLNWLAGKPAQQHLRRQISDKALRQALTPDYTIGCKRVLLSSHYYPALNRPNVHLHTKDAGIARFTPDGVICKNEQKIDLDIVIFATGYDATDGLVSYPVSGENGQTLQQRWADYPRAYLGTCVADFPNFFIVTGPNTGIGHTSAIFMIESQMRYIMQAISSMQERQANQISIRSEAEQAYTDMVHQQMAKTVWHTGGCNSWYKSASGKVIAMFPGFSFTFRRLCNQFKPQHHLYK